MNRLVDLLTINYTTLWPGVEEIVSALPVNSFASVLVCSCSIFAYIEGGWWLFGWLTEAHVNCLAANCNESSNSIWRTTSTTTTTTASVGGTSKGIVNNIEQEEY